MSVHDLVKITQYLTRAQDIPAYAGSGPGCWARRGRPPC